MTNAPRHAADKDELPLNRIGSAFKDVYHFHFPELRLVSDEVFAKAQRPVGKRPTRDAHRYLLEDRVICPVCGARMELVMSQKRKIIRCGHRGKFHPAQSNYSNVVLEQIATMQATALLDRYTYDRIFAEELNSELNKRAEELALLLKQNKRDAAKDARALGRAMEKQLTAAGHVVHTLAIEMITNLNERAVKSAAEEKATAAELVLLESRIADLPNWIATVSEELRALNIIHPWKPNTDKERAFFSRMREFIGSIALDQSGRVYTATSTFVFFKGAKDITRTVSCEHIGIKVIRERKSKDWQDIRRQFDTSSERLKDDEFAKMPRLRDQYGTPEELRFLVDVLLVAKELDLDPQNVLSSLASDRAQELRKLRVYGDLQTVLGHLQQTRGSDFDMQPAKPQPGRSEWARLLHSRDPILVLDVCDPESGKNELSDGQWSAIADIFAKGGRLSKLGGSPRETLNAYYAIIRQRLPIWMAERVGSVPNTIHYLIGYRAQLTEVTRRLLRFQGYALSAKFIRPRRKIGSFATVRNFDAVMREIRNSLERIKPAALPPDDLVVRCLDLTYDLSTDEAIDRTGCVAPLTPQTRRGVRFFLTREGAVVATPDYLRGIGSAGVADQHGKQMVNNLRHRLKRVFPEFSGAIETVKLKGYRLAAVVETISGGQQPDWR